MSYASLKFIHVLCVLTSGAGFALRAYWRHRDSPRMAQAWVRVAPHMVDTLLLGSAIAMAVISGQYPFVAPWLTAKVLGLLAYIGLGSLALSPRRSPALRLWLAAAALLVYAQIVVTALTRDPLGLLTWL